MPRDYLSSLLLALILLSACGRERAPVTTPTAVPPLPTFTSALPTATPTATATTAPPTPEAESIVPARQDSQDLQARIPALATRVAAFAEVIAADVPVLPLSADTLDEQQRMAQATALATPAFTQYTRALTDGSPLRSEIFNVLPLRPDSITDATRVCAAQTACYRVELYNYALNLTSVAVVDVDAGRVLDVEHMQDVQPELPPALAELARAIALNAPETAAAVCAHRLTRA